MGIRVVIVERHVGALQGFLVKLERHPDISVAGILSSVLTTDGLVRLIDQHHPDVVLLDASTGLIGLNTLSAISTVNQAYPGIHLLCVVNRNRGMFLRWLVSLKVRGCIFHNDERLPRVGEIVHEISEGETVYSQEIVEHYSQLPGLVPTQLDLEVMVRVELGFSNRAIAEQLSISPSTVSRHLSKIYAKLGVPEDGVDRRIWLVNQIS
jgi:DNA-binding NarL/FixJ family response regulator